MPVISDSSAILDIQKMLPQHQAAITLLNVIVQNPKISNVSWLDLACGKGQIISQLHENLSEDNRKKIIYHGYDINVDYTRIVSKMATTLGFYSQEIFIGDISSFGRILNVDIKYDFITCTNVAHELHPYSFLELILNAILRLKENGQLFIYDMESLSSPELGALPLKRDEIKILLDLLLKSAGSMFEVSVSMWEHKTCNGWSTVIDRHHLNVDNQAFIDRHDAIKENLKNEIKRLLTKRFELCEYALDTLTKYGAETGDEEDQKIMALYEFWALYKALED